MWSRHLAPKPKDWPDHVEIVGAFVDRSGSAAAAVGSPPSVSTPLSPLEDTMNRFLAPDLPAPIFIGFGSMVVADTPALIKVICCYMHIYIYIFAL